MALHINQLHVMEKLILNFGNKHLPDDSPEYVTSLILQVRKGKEDKTVFLLL